MIAHLQQVSEMTVDLLFASVLKNQPNEFGNFFFRFLGELTCQIINGLGSNVGVFKRGDRFAWAGT